MKKYVVFLIILFFISCKKNQETSQIKNNPLTKSVIQNEKSAQLNCEEVLLELIKSSNLKSLKDFSDWKSRIDEKNSEKFVLKIYTENDLSENPAKKQIVENAVSWLEFYPKTSKLYDVTFDPENSQELNFDKNILKRNTIFEICGIVSSKENIQKIGKTECEKIIDEMLSGEECVIYSSTIKQAYLDLIKDKKLDDTAFLQKNLPQKSLKQNINKNGLNGIDYTISQDDVKILLHYDGGETSVELQKKDENVLRRIIYSYD